MTTATATLDGNTDQSYDNDAAAAGDDDALYIRLRRWYRQANEHLSGWKTDAREDFAFAAGEQWSEEDKAALREQMRPVITFNRIAPVIKSVAGMEVGNRQAVTYLPREVNPEDNGVSEMMTNAAKFFRDESEAEDEESDAFFDTIVCGLGCTETRPDFEQDSDGLIPTDRIDPLSTFYDPNSRKRNVTDRRFCGYVKEMSFEDARSLYPGKTDDELNAQWAVAGMEDMRPHDATPQRAYNQGDQSDRTKERRLCSIVYFEWWDREAVYVLKDPLTGKKTELSATQLAELKKRFGMIAKALGVEVPNLTKMAVKLTRKVYKKAFVGGEVLEQGPGRCPDEFTVNFITGDRDRNRNVWYGLVRAMKDPQRWSNKFFSTIIHRISTTGKGLMMEKDAVENVRKFEDDWARSDAIKWVKPGAIAGEKTKELTGGAVLSSETQMMEFAISSIRDVSGVNLEMLGAAETDQAGIVELHRKKAGMTILATLFDSLRRYRKQQGKALLYIIQKYIPDGRLIRIDGTNGRKYVQLAKNPEVTKYDVIVDENPSSPNQKEAVWAMLSQMMPLLMKLPVPAGIWSKLIEYSPLPNELANDISQMIQQQAAQPPPPDPKLQQIQMQAKFDLEEQQRDAQIAQQKAQDDHIARQQELANKTQEAHLSLMQDMVRFREEMAEQRAQGALELQIQREKGEQQVDTAEKMAAVQRKTAASRPKQQGK